MVSRAIAQGNPTPAEPPLPATPIAKVGAAVEAVAAHRTASFDDLHPHPEIAFTAARSAAIGAKNLKAPSLAVTEVRALMIRAAQTARHHGAVAGTWLETERAEYRLALTWLQAGDLAQARTHAQNCLAVVAANEGAALERLFGWEALGRVERAAGNATGQAQALAHARTAFAALDASDQSWCRASIDKLAAP